MERIVRFWRKLEEDFSRPKIENFWVHERHLVIELSEWELKFFVEDHGRLLIGDHLHEVRLQRASKEIGIYETKRSVPVPTGMSSHDTYLKIKLLETAPEKLAEEVIWGIFWQLEIETSYHNPKKSWMYPFAKDYLEHCHRVIQDRNLRSVQKVMEA